MSFVGDVNGDGYDDIAVGAISATPNGAYSGATYIVFGHEGAGSTVSLPSVPGSAGLELDGGFDHGSARSVSAAGDVNGDGFADVIVGNDYFGNGPAAYVVFGTNAGFPPAIDLTTLDGSNGFTIDVNGLVGRVNDVSTAGDINGDGYADLVVGDPQIGQSGTAFVVFGHAGAFDAAIDVGTLDGSNGFAITGQTVHSGDEAGISVASAGDFNGDGYADLLIGADRADATADAAGVAYVVYGTAAGFGASIDLGTLDGHNGFAIEGIAAGDRVGRDVASAGDINGDGFDDILVGARYANGAEGAAYVIYGGDYRTDVTHMGTTGNDTMSGNATAELFVGGVSNDTMSGGGGADVFQGGAGNDDIHVGDHTFRLADGGNGTDTLHLDFAGAVDFGDLDANAATSDRGKIANIEVLSVDNGQANSLTLHLADVLDMHVQTHDVGGVHGLDNTLKIDGNAGDMLQLSASDQWSAADTATLAGYAVYTAGAVKIAVEADIAVHTA